MAYEVWISSYALLRNAGDILRESKILNILSSNFLRTIIAIMFASKKHWFSRILSNWNFRNFFHPLGNEPEIGLRLKISKSCNTSITKHPRINMCYFCKSRVQLKTSQLLLQPCVREHTHSLCASYVYRLKNMVLNLYFLYLFYGSNNKRLKYKSPIIFILYFSGTKIILLHT